MKTNKTKQWVVFSVGVAVLTSAALPALADQNQMPPQSERHYSGTVVSVAPQDRMVRVKSGWFFARTFNLGDNCAYAMLGATNGSIADLRPGEKVTIGYQTTQGVHVADYVRQHPLQVDGTVTVVDPGNHLLIVHRRGMDKELRIAEGCKIALRDQRTGSFADIKPGNHVTVTYEIPADVPTAREIAQTSEAFVGTLTAIDLGEKTVKARAVFATKKFNVADNCAIVINGRTDGKLADLRPDQKLEFSYDQVNGVNVVNRIAPAPQEQQKTMTTSSPMSYPTYPAY
jgi:hypothetical protein